MDASEGESDSANKSQESTIIKLKLAEVNCSIVGTSPLQQQSS